MRYREWQVTITEDVEAIVRLTVRVRYPQAYYEDDRSRWHDVVRDERFGDTASALAYAAEVMGTERSALPRPAPSSLGLQTA